MRILLDTHVALWAITGDPRLSREARHLITTAAEVRVSAATVWEIAIKHALAKDRPERMPVSGARALEHFLASGFTLLPITGEHAAAIGRLPALHRDPFDRVLVAQALDEPLRFLTHDPLVASYDPGIVLV